MEFGSKEWFEELNNRVTFPAIISFYYDKQENRITTRRVETKVKNVDNVRYEALKVSALYFQNKKSALIKTEKIESDKHFYDELVKLIEFWEVEAY